MRDVTVVVGDDMLNDFKLKGVSMVKRKLVKTKRNKINRVRLYVTNEGCNCCTW